jgi:hypothetical protein
MENFENWRLQEEYFERGPYSRHLGDDNLMSDLLLVSNKSDI